MERRDATTAGRSGASRVLVFAVDDVFFSLQLDWVEAVCPRAAVALREVKVAGRPQRFFVYRGEPAFPVELRTVFDVPSGGRRVERGAYLIVRSGSYLLALQIDACVGVQEIDLSSTVPIPSKLVGDGGVPVGHLVEAGEEILVVLDPHRLAGGVARDHLALALRAAKEFQEREQAIEELWTAICSAPSVSDVRKYARLCRRNGHGKMARAARVILKHMTDCTAETVSANGGGGGAADQMLIGTLVRFACARRTGEIAIEAGGADVGRVVLASGQVLAASCGGATGRDALVRLLALPETRPHIIEGSSETGCEVIADSAIAFLIDALASGAGERRFRRGE